MTASERAKGDRVPAPFGLWQMAMNLPFAMSIETLRFLGHRMTAQAELLSELAHASGSWMAVRSYRDFMEGAATDYRKEAKALSEAAEDVLRN